MTRNPVSQQQVETKDLFDLVYYELRKIAAEKMSREAPNSTLQATALVNEAWLRLGADRQPRWKSKRHFYFSAAEAMRRILIDRARRKKRQRHGGDHVRLEVDDMSSFAKEDLTDPSLLAVADALEEFAAVYPKKAELVKLRYFVGLTFEEVGQTLNISERTAKRWWVFAKAWLYDNITRS